MPPTSVAIPDVADACAGFAWLPGTWKTAGSDTHNLERWMTDDNDSLRGESVTRSGGEVVFTESLRIVRGPGGFEYRASPQGQSPNVFLLEACGATWAQFTDPAHDWPQSIHYAREGDTLTATVGGSSDGKERIETWSWTLQ
jgi:hypothetical protein